VDVAVRIVGLSGSLRAGSWNTAVLRSAAELLPEGASLEIVAYGDVPLYNFDLGEPEAVARFKATLAAADALLIATPEYIHSVPGVLKNALDWASRPAGKGPLVGTPTAVLSASPGAVGGARAQQHLKAILLGGNTPVYAGPEVVVGGADKKITDGRLTDETTRQFLATWLKGFVAWAERQRA